jgi:hypothetical protein
MYHAMMRISWENSEQFVNNRVMPLVSEGRAVLISEKIHKNLKIGL